MPAKLFLPILLFLCCTTYPAFVQDTGLGKIDFPTSANGEAQQHFINGVLLLHSFEYEDAREAFQLAQQLKPDFTMAYWGEAMTFNHPIWFNQDKDKALAALARLAATPAARQATTNSQKEKEWLQAVDILYGEGDKQSRDYRYSDFMAGLYKKYPKDDEVASFYALSILGTSHGERDIRKYMRAAAVVEEVYARNSLHPGGLHYLIHSYDDPVHAVLGLRAARIYAEVAPSAAHALHMPSHIFVALGMWDEVVLSNIASSAAADARRARKELDVDARGYHSLWWLQYGYLQRGQLGEARKLLKDMERDASESESKRVQNHLVYMRAAWMIDSEQWDDPIVKLPLPERPLDLITKSIHHYATAYAAFRQRDTAILNNATGQFEALLPTKAMVNPEAAAASCCAPNNNNSGELSLSDLQAMQVMHACASAMQLWLAGQQEAALQNLTEAADLEAKMSFMFGPPVIVKPGHELLGELLLEAGKAGEAIAVLEQGLMRATHRTRLLIALERAAAMAGDKAKAESCAEQLKVNLQAADEAFRLGWTE